MNSHLRGDADPASAPLDPEDFWAEVLSANPDRVRRAVAGVPAEDRAAVVRHLRTMTAEAGWQEGQRNRARAALDAIGELPPYEDE